MSLITEDGTGMPTAESYASVYEADLYHLNRANTLWATLTTSDKEAALRRAVDYMTEAYRGRWKGYRSQIYQALDWPRKSVIITDMAINYMIPVNSIPNELKNAQIEMAVRAAAAALAPDLERGIRSESVVGVSTVYDTGSQQFTRYRQVDMMLRPFLIGSGAMTQLVKT